MAGKIVARVMVQPEDAAAVLADQDAAKAKELPGVEADVIGTIRRMEREYGVIVTRSLEKSAYWSGPHGQVFSPYTPTCPNGWLEAWYCVPVLISGESDSLLARVSETVGA